MKQESVQLQWLRHIERVLIENQGNRLTPVVINGLMHSIMTSLPPFAADQPPPQPKQDEGPKLTLGPIPEVEPFFRHRAPVSFCEVGFGVLRLDEALQRGLAAVHAAHWQETEAYRNDTAELKPDYALMKAYEALGRFVQFVVIEKKNRTVVGGFACYIERSTHTGELVATEDSLYVLPDFRRNGIGDGFIRYIHSELQQLGVKELRVTCKTTNKVGELLQRKHGYEHVSNGYVKRLDKPLYAPLRD